MMVTADFRRAIREFEELLEDTHSKESEWQKLFSRYPFLLSDGLALDIEPEALIPCKPGEPQADFYFYPSDGSPASPYGVIELKRPGTQLLRLPRKDVVCLSADMTAALAQATKYAEELHCEVKRSDSGLVVLGNRLHTFVIAGLSEEIARKVTTGILRERAASLIPSGCQLLPFDTLVKRLASRTPPRLHVLVPAIPTATRQPDRPSFQRESGFRPRSGIFGGPRKLYPGTCSECQNVVWIPFRPVTGRTVFCRDCYMRRQEQRT
jgi:CxxC-x17-CxxC domain-containing protein